MATLFIRHWVEDYEAWKRVYDAYDRKGDGCTRATVRSLSTVVRHSGESIREQSPVW